MSLIESAKQELNRSPITVAGIFLGQITGGLALLVAWLQYAGVPAVASSPSNSPSAKINLSNFLVCLAFFISTSISLGSIVRLLARVQWFAALVVSIPMAVLSAFGTMLILHLIPPKAFAQDILATVQNIVLWGTCLVFIAINGLPTLHGIAHPNPKSPTKNEEIDGLGIFGMAIILLMIWSLLVSSGLSKMIQVFL